MMKVQSLFCALCFSLFIFTSTNAQTILDYVPADASMVLKMNPPSIENKVDVDALLKMDFFDSILQEIANGLSYDKSENIYKFLKTPSEYGVRLNAPSYVVVDMSDEGTFFSTLFELEDVAAFQSFYTENMMTEEQGMVEQMNGFSIVRDATGNLMTWNKEVLILSNGNVEYDYYDYSMEEFNEADSLQKVKILDYAIQMMSKASGSTIKDNARYMSNSQGDINFWMDYGYFQRMGLSDSPLSAGMSEMKPFMDVMASMYEDTYVSYTMNFDNGAVNMDVKTFMPPQVSDLWSKSMDTDFNKKLARYINGDDLMGLFYLNYDLEKTFQSLEDMFIPMVEQMAGMPDIGNILMDIVGIAIDEEALYDMWKGDMVMTINGLREFEKEIVTYEYDDDFNPIETKKMSTQQLPEFTLLMSTDNKKDWEKILRLGEKMAVVEKKGLYYSIAAPEIPMDIFLAIENGVLMITNNKAIVSDRLKSGFKRKNRLKKDYCRLLHDNSSVFVWDIGTTLDVVSTLGLPDDFMGMQMLNASKDTFESIIATGSKTVKNGTFDGKMSFNMVNKNQNALEQFFNFINDIYISQTGGRSM